jgi:hypothetical protein
MVRQLNGKMESSKKTKGVCHHVNKKLHREDGPVVSLP